MVLTKSFWKYIFSWKRLGITILSTIGVFWTIIEIVSFFSQESGEYIKTLWWLVIIAVVITTLIQIFPKLKIRRKIKGKDVSISIKIGNIFDSAKKCDLIIPFNTSFDTSLNGVISPQSVQGQFTNRYYDSFDHLDSDIKNANKCIEKESFIDKQNGNPYKYPIGTVVKVSNPKIEGRYAYFSCIADMNENSNASTTLANIQDSLAKLWVFISQEGELSEIAIPVIGTGRGRIAETREELICEIIDSFLVFNMSSKIANSLTIFIRPEDLNNHEIDFKKIEEYLHFKTNFTRSINKSKDVGTAVQ